MADDLMAGGAYVEVMPSAKGWAKRLDSQIGDKPVVQNVEPVVSPAALAKARQQVETAAAKVAEARTKEADAAGAVRVAELKLDELRGSANAKASQIAAAEERVEAARRKSAAAAEILKKAESNERSAVGRSERLEIRADSRPAEQEVDGFASRVRGKVSDLGAKLGPIAAAGLAGAGAAIGLALVGALDVSAAQGKLAAQLGGTPEYAAEMGKVAGSLYSKGYGESLGEVNDALRAVVQSGALMEDATDEQIGSMTAKALGLGQAFGVDVAEGARAAGTMMRNGLAPDAETAMDIIYRGFQQGVDVGGDFLDTLNEYSGQFQKLGLDGATATGILSQGLKAGARDSDFVADALKEFSIRAIDGSKSTAEGFQLIGLNADQMRAKIAAGGPAAKEGLGQVLDGLRSIKDPALQSQAAVDLFGTKAEDLGAALLALDPSTAAQGLGDIAGAAQQADAAMTTPATRIEALKRTFEMAFIDVLGGKVLPILSTVLDWGQRAFAWGPLPEVLNFLLTSGGVALGVLLAIVGAIKLWSLVQAGFNAVMAMNPITLWIVGIAALVAAVVYAYNNFEWFRNAVQAVWSFLQAAGSWIGSVFVAVWSGLVVAAEAVGSAFSWLWSNVLSPVFSALGVAARVVAAIVITVLITPLLLAWQGLVAGISWWWENVLSPCWDAIAAAAGWLYQNVLLPIWSGMQAGWAALLAAFAWAWQNVLLPVWQAIQATASWLWSNVLAPVFGWIEAGWAALLAGMQWYWQNLLYPAWQALAAAGQWLWSNVLSPVFGWIAAGWRGLLDGINWVWLNVLKPALDAVGRAFDGVWQVVQNVVQWIGDRWADLQDLARKPAEFLVNTVYNNGIRPVWNGVAKTFGLGELGEVRMAHGGVLPGYAPGRDTIPVLASPGEGWLVPEAVKGLGRGFIGWANRYFSGGRSSGGQGTGPRKDGDLGYMGDWRQRFADGGIVGAIVNAAKGLPFVGSLIQSADLASVGANIFTGGDWRAVMKPLLEQVVGGVAGSGAWSEMLVKMAGKVVDTLAGAIENSEGNYTGEGGSGFAAALGWAKSQVGKPYTWGGSGNPGWDCSGFIAGITNVIMGKAPGRIGTTASMPWGMFRPGNDGPFVVGNSRNTGGGIGHMAGTLLGTNVESYGGHGPAVGPGARGAGDRLFPEKWRYFDEGGLASGRGILLKDVITPERVLSSRQTEAFEDLVPLLERMGPMSSAGPAVRTDSLEAVATTSSSGDTYVINPSAQLDEFALAHETARIRNFSRRVNT